MEGKTTHLDFEGERKMAIWAKKMTAAERAKDITLFLERDRSLEQAGCRQLLATDIPLDSRCNAFGLMVNFGIEHLGVSLPILWALTVPVIQKLHRAKKLGEFKLIGTQVVALDGATNLGRIIRVESLVNEIPNLSARKMDDLLNESLWDAERFSCHWYWKKGLVTGLAG